MPLAARHTATSSMRAGFRELPCAAQKGLSAVLAGVMSNVVGEAGDQLGSLG
jgi:hypothetical protein